MMLERNVAGPSCGDGRRSSSASPSLLPTCTASDRSAWQHEPSYLSLSYSLSIPMCNVRTHTLLNTNKFHSEFSPNLFPIMW